MQGFVLEDFENQDYSLSTIFGLNNKMKSFISLTLIMLCCASVSLASAESTQQKQTKIEKKIKSKKSDINKSRAVSTALQKKARDAEAKLNAASKELHTTEQEVSKLTTTLLKSNTKKSKLKVQNTAQKDALAQQMQALYTSGKQSHLRLLLKQDDPSDISRTVKYYEYMNAHRLERIRFIKTRLNKIKDVEEQINLDSEKLKSLQATQQSKQKALKLALSEKNRAHKKQRKVVRSKEQELAALRKEESKLKSVIQNLINKQKREERQKAKADAAKKKTPKTNTAKTKPKSTPKGKVVERHYVPNKPFSSLKGRLSWPVKGRITQKYGSARNTKITWKGVIISAPGGTNVHAVARGKVEFSGRLKGYGYVTIIRHDKNYRSLYAYNRSIYKKAGQIVKTGEVIAAVGNSGRLDKPGLYFEISKGVTRYNPASWCR